jgi:hypothetical protein
MTSPGQWPRRRRPSITSPMPSRRVTCGLRSRPSATSGIIATHSSGRACNAKSPLRRRLPRAGCWQRPGRRPLSAQASTTSRSPTGWEYPAAVCAGKPSTGRSGQPPVLLTTPSDPRSRSRPCRPTTLAELMGEGCRDIVKFSHRRHHGNDRGHGGRGDAAPRARGLPPAGLSGTRHLREVPGFLGFPPLRRWAARKACQVYHHGFIRGLAQNPKATMLAIVDTEAGSCNRRRRGRLKITDG